MRGGQRVGDQGQDVHRGRVIGEARAARKTSARPL
jgi:hypothetical protein